MSIRHVLRCLLATSLLATSLAEAAKVDPPTIALGRATTSLVVADYREAGPDNRVVFERVRTIRSPVEVPELIDLAKPDLQEPLVIGQRYLLGYTVVANDKRKRLSKRASGAAFLSSPGLEPALWAFSAANEAMLTWRISDTLAETQKEVPRLLDLLKTGDAQQRSFAAAEITYRPALLAVLSPREQKALRRFVDDGSAPDPARASLLSMAYNMPDVRGARRGWDGVARDLLADSPIDVAGQVGRSRLLLAAFAHLQATGAPLSPAIAKRWLHSDDMAIIEAAAGALQAQSPELARTEVKAALSSAMLAPGARDVLEQWQRRLQAAPDAG